MASTTNKPFVGQRVYYVCSPLKAGIITEVIGPVRIPKHDGGIYISSFYTVKVRWLNGKVDELSTNSLRDFDALIAETQKKLNTHLATKAKLEALCTSV